MQLTLYQLTFHENLFYATREVGRLYETGRCLHNYALTYALGLASAPYFQAQQIPAYAEELGVLNSQGIYVTPARGVKLNYQLVTFKFADNAYRVKMQPSSRNVPSYGRAKEAAVGSAFELAVIHPQAFIAPRWIRMGLWRSKALLELLGSAELKPASGSLHVASLPLNPLDVEGEFKLYDLISMPPSSLVEHAQLETDWLMAEVANRTVYLPARMKFNFHQEK